MMRRTMNGPILLVPGTGGTKLLKNGQSLGHPVVLNAKLWLLKSLGEDINQTVLDMSMRHEAGRAEPVRTTLADASEVTPGPVLGIPYNLALPKVSDTYRYDWRGDIEASARGLIAHLEKKPAAARWRLVTHSQGGLVAVAASKLLVRENRSFSALVSHIAFVGVPLYGTLNAANALLVGTELGEAPKEEFRRIAGTWPALYQMLPSWFALRTPTGDYSQYSFFHKRTYGPYPWIDPNLVARAWSVRRDLLNHPASALSGIRYRFYFTKNRMTWDRAVRRDDGTIAFGDKSVAGDSLVPFAQTYKLMSDVEQQRVDAVDAQANTPEHAMLLTDDWITSRVFKDLEA